jgi:hypothetical protein
MGGLGDHIKRLPRGLGDYLEPGALDRLKPAELKALRATVASRMPGTRDDILRPHGLVDFVGPGVLDDARADRLTAYHLSWLEQIRQELGDAFSTPRYVRPRPNPAGISRELRRRLPDFGDYLSKSAEALGRMPRGLAGMLGDFRANPLDFLSQASDGLTGLGMAIPLTRPALIIGEGTKVGRGFNYTGTVLEEEANRRYLNSPLLIQEIMSTGRGIPDPGGIRGGLRYDVPGTYGKSRGIYELVVTPKNKSIWHYTYESKK